MDEFPIEQPPASSSSEPMTPVDADPFAPLTEGERSGPPSDMSSAATDQDDSDTLERLPCPQQGLTTANFRHRKYGLPSRFWLWRAAHGTVSGVTARYEVTKPDGSPDKVVLPWSFGRRYWTDRLGTTHDVTGWHLKGWPEPRPLFGLDQLQARPDVPVVVVEGEKKVEGGAALFPDFVFTTSQGGSNAAAKSDWLVMRGRIVLIWGDNDNPGRAYAADVARLAKEAGAKTVAIVDVPKEWPKSWDLADPPPNGVTFAQLQAMLDAALARSATEMPDGFRMTAEGLVFDDEPTGKNSLPSAVRIAAPFEVVAETCDESGEGWGLLLEWRDRAGRRHRLLVSRQLIHQQGNQIAEQLEHAGLSCGVGRMEHDLLKRYFGGVRARRLLRSVTRTGWHQTERGPVFVLPGGETFGRQGAEVILQPELASLDNACQPAGNLADWQHTVATWAEGNDRAALYLSASFTGPLLALMGEPSGGFHLHGDSRTGKSTLLLGAASVWGRPAAEAQLRVWRGTANGLEATAAITTDTLLCLDEIGQAHGHEVGETIYMLGNEAGKLRASRAGTARPRHSWRLIFLSTGEVTLAQKIAEANKRVTAGLDVRMVNVPADAGEGMGVFQDLHGFANAAALVEALREAALAQYGTAARVFLTRLVEERAENEAALRDRLAALRDSFLANYVPQAATGQVRSVARRFALVAAAGEMARDYGVLPWAAGEAMRACGACFSAWLTKRGGTGPAEEAAALAQVRAFFEKHGEARFTPLLPPNHTEEAVAPEVTRTANRAGFRRFPDGMLEYLVLPEAWTGEVCQGFDPTWVADLLAERGLLQPGKDGKRSDSLRISGLGKLRVYRVSGAILGHDGSTEVAGTAR